jgi:hypothetical protein
VPSQPEFEVEVDAAARAWLDEHPTRRPRSISYEIHRCCGGGKICDVKVQDRASRYDPSAYAVAVLSNGTELAIDPKAAARLPSWFRITVRGLGPLKHLDLDLTGEQWGRLLYS